MPSRKDVELLESLRHRSNGSVREIIQTLEDKTNEMNKRTSSSGLTLYVLGDEGASFKGRPSRKSMENLVQLHVRQFEEKGPTADGTRASIPAASSQLAEILSIESRKKTKGIAASLQEKICSKLGLSQPQPVNENAATCDETTPMKDKSIIGVIAVSSDHKELEKLKEELTAGYPDGKLPTLISPDNSRDLDSEDQMPQLDDIDSEELLPNSLSRVFDSTLQPTQSMDDDLTGKQKCMLGERNSKDMIVLADREEAQEEKWCQELAENSHNLLSSNPQFPHSGKPATSPHRTGDQEMVHGADNLTKPLTITLNSEEKHEEDPPDMPDMDTVPDLETSSTFESLSQSLRDDPNNQSDTQTKKHSLFWVLTLDSDGGLHTLPINLAAFSGVSILASLVGINPLTTYLLLSFIELMSCRMRPKQTNERS